MNPVKTEIEPALLALLHALLDRIDKKPFAERTRDLTLPLTPENWPEFFAIEHPGERALIWRRLEALMKQPGFMLKSDQRKTKLDLDIWQRLPKLIVTDQAEVFLRDLTKRPAKDVSWMTQWRQAIQDFITDQKLAECLLARPIHIAQRSPLEVLQRFMAISALSDSGLMLQELASRQFWGLSKILNDQQQALTLLLGESTCPFPDKPVQLLVSALEANINAPILLIENAATFESLASGRLAAARGYILVFASGYRASARRIRQRCGSSVYFSCRAGNQASVLQATFLDWLYSSDHQRPVYFWGDLDYAGMAILKEIRVVFPTAQAWQPGYDALLAQLQTGESHAAEEAKKSGQLDPLQTGCHYADQVLLPALRAYGKFVDQESL